MSVREPVLNPVAIKELRPTQISVGFREVAEKQRQWREQAGDKGSEFLGRHMIPVVWGPKARHYIVDHHHLCRALEAAPHPAEKALIARRLALCVEPD